MYKKPFPEVHSVDFDGLLCEDKFPQIGKENRETIDFFKSLQEQGEKLILNTCRCDEYLEAAVEWCKKRGLVFDAVNENLIERIDYYGGDCRKINADYYWDDKNMSIDITPCIGLGYKAVKQPLTRESILDDAKRIITTDREKQYGAPENNFGNIAEYWSTYLRQPLTAHDVAIMMTLLKIARIQSGQFKTDSYVDACGYLALAGEVGGKNVKSY